MRRSRLVLAATTLALAACRHPPDAPASLDELSGYLFANFDDAAAMEAGLGNLRAWLEEGDHLAETLDGYTVSNLSQDAVSGLDDQERVLEDLHGAAVGTEGATAVPDIVNVLVEVDPVELSPGMYESYEREFLSDPDCFVAGECEELAVFNTMVSTYLGGTVVIETETNGRYRWVDTEYGPAMVQRTWLEGPAEVSLDWLEVDEQFYLNVVMPRDDGSLRLQAMWVVARMGDSSVPEDVALQLVIDSMQGVYEDVDGWIEAHGAGGPPPEYGCAAAGGGAGPWGLLVALGALLRRKGGAASAQGR